MRARRPSLATVPLESTFFVQRVSCEGVCGPWRVTRLSVSRGSVDVEQVRAGAFLRVADLTDPSLLELAPHPVAKPDADAQETDELSPEMQRLG